MFKEVVQGWLWLLEVVRLRVVEVAQLVLFKEVVGKKELED